MGRRDKQTNSTYIIAKVCGICAQILYSVITDGDRYNKAGSWMRECSILRKDESAGGEDEATMSLE